MPVFKIGGQNRFEEKKVLDWFRSRQEKERKNHAQK